MANLISTIGYNSNIARTDKFDFGTPQIYPLVVNRNDEGDWTGSNLPDSDYFKVLRTIQNRAEIYGVGEISGTMFTLLVRWYTLAQDSGDSFEPNDEDDLGYLEQEISDSCGVGVNVWAGKIQGDNISYNC